MALTRTLIDALIANHNHYHNCHALLDTSLSSAMQCCNYSALTLSLADCLTVSGTNQIVFQHSLSGLGIWNLRSVSSSPFAAVPPSVCHWLIEQLCASSGHGRLASDVTDQLSLLNVTLGLSICGVLSISQWPPLATEACCEMRSAWQILCCLFPTWKHHQLLA